MNFKERKILYISLIISILLHVAGIILFNTKYLLGSTDVKKPEELEPIELVFEHPKTQPENEIPQKFYQIVENPNASKTEPTASDMLSTESSVSASPVRKPEDLRAVPGQEDAEKRIAKKSYSEPAENERLQQVVDNALLAYRSAKSFDKSALQGKERTKSRGDEPAQQEKGEADFQPDGFNADLVGDFALSTYAWNWAPYWLAFKRKLNRVWYAPPAYSELGLIHGYSIVRFKITPDGRMFDFQVLKHVGHSSLEESSVSAMESMFPFLPLPEDFPDENLEVTIKMIYPDLRKYFSQ